MTIDSIALGKLLGHQPVEIDSIEGRKVQLLGEAEEVKPQTNRDKKQIVRENARKYYERNRERVLAKQREYKAQKAAAEGKPAPVPRKSAKAVHLNEQPASAHKVNPDTFIKQPSDPGQEYPGINIDVPAPVVYAPKTEQRFEVHGPAAFRIAQTMFQEDLLTCSMVIEGQNLQFIFKVKGKS